MRVNENPNRLQSSGSVQPIGNCYKFKYTQPTSRLQRDGSVIISLTPNWALPTLFCMEDTSTIVAINLSKKLEAFQDFWSPKIVGELNDSYVKLAKLKGEFVWHHHDAEDELFLVLKGTLLMKLRDRDIRVEPGEFVIIPRGVDHLPVAEEETQVLLLEPKSTLNTGNIQSDRTIANLDRI